jgi:Rrf2 family transcriptional regulator, repressor of oqxAB
MIDVRFPTALQLLLTLALAEEEGHERLSSSHLALGLGVQSSFVRKLLQPLIGAGLINSALGRDGGVRLGRPAEKITLREVYCAVTGDKTLWQARRVPHRCVVSSNMERYFVQLTGEADEAIMTILDGQTLADSLAELHAMDAARRAR